MGLLCLCVCVQEKRPHSKLPRALRGLMGEANIRYARGDKEDAILMCMEIIRQGMKQGYCFIYYLFIYLSIPRVCNLNQLWKLGIKNHISSPVSSPPAPLAYEPFSTLAMIYEDDGDTDKALQFGLIAAHLNPSDCEEWVKLAEMSLEQDNIRQAIICYSKGRSDSVKLLKCLHLYFSFVITKHPVS